jgi:hypothetical protein
LILQRIPIVENFFVILKQFHLSHVTVADPDSSDSSRLYRTSVTDPSVTGQYNLIPRTSLVSAPKEIFTSKINSNANFLKLNVLLELIMSPCKSFVECVYANTMVTS